MLTLTATPIPRTLQMSLSGVRDITVIETPPRDRHPIQTYVGLYDEGMVERAIEREIDRGGQVYYLHNRVETIDKAAMKLRTVMPNVRFGVAHGQMPEQDLERVMLDFLRGDQDVLVSTTIIESGLDIPNANTLIVERADLLGLAQLYQIRGRIGRSARVAHAFLFHPDEAVLTEEAVARLSTLADYTELGSGLQDRHARPGDPGRRRVAGGGAVRADRGRGVRDVPVDAGGGHPATAGRRGDHREATPAWTSASTRMCRRPSSGTRRPAWTCTGGSPRRGVMEELIDLRAELVDRFGELPEPVDNLIFLGEVRVQVQNLGADSLSVRQDRLVVSGLTLPPGSRERLRSRDRRYVYAPVQGQLSLGFKGESRGVRAVVQAVLDDILPLSAGEVVSDR